MGKVIYGDLTGRVFGRLTVLYRVEPKQRRVMWVCSCKCGGTKAIYVHSLTGGLTTSCGCIQRKHGQTDSRTFRIWTQMRRRCYEPLTHSYAHYGGRGIAVCDRWRYSFANFLADMGHCPDGLSIDRIDGHGPYEPGNCRWATAQEQARNKDGTHRLTVDGVTLTLPEWAERVGMTSHALRARLYRGWPPEKAVRHSLGQFLGLRGRPPERAR